MAEFGSPIPLSFLIISIMLILVPRCTSALSYRTGYCTNSSTYSPNSSFPNTLTTLLQSLTSNATLNSAGFHTTSVSANRTTIYGMFLCQGDQNNSGCKSCVSTAVRELPEWINCPRTQEAVVWYGGCMVRYSDQPLAGILDKYPLTGLVNTQNIDSNQTIFTQVLGSNMLDLADEAANKDPKTGKKYATRVVGYDANFSYRMLYMMVQCTPDLLATDCKQCLVVEINRLSTQQGAEYFQPSCRARYEIYPFFAGSLNSSSAPPNPPPLPPGIVPTNNLPGVNPGTISEGKSKVSMTLIMAIVIPLILAIAVALVFFCIYLCIRKTKKNHDFAAVETQDVTNDGFSIFESLQYDLSILQSATNNFSEENKLGAGGFGSVYKGKLTNGLEIAVKKLSKSSSQGVQEFKNEALLVAKLQHRNLARLLGFCVAGEERLLVYEFVPNKSLDHFLFDKEYQQQLEWKTRYKIIKGIARGMLYLHQDSQLRIIHRDLKASNILLDAEMNPKISDFGLSRIMGVDQTQVKIPS